VKSELVSDKNRRRGNEKFPRLLGFAQELDFIEVSIYKLPPTLAGGKVLIKEKGFSQTQIKINHPFCFN